MKFHDFSPFYRSSEGIKPKVSGDRLLDNPLVADVQSGASFKFDGDNDRVILPTSTLNRPSDGTITAWVKYDSIGTSPSPWINGSIISKGNVYFSLTNTSSKNLVAYYNNSSGSAISTIASTSVLETGKWYFVTYAWTPTTSLLYLDGVQEYSGTNIGIGYDWNSDAETQTGTCYIGDTSSGTANNGDFDGEIRQVRIHNRALSADEVRAAYSGQAVPFEYKDASQTNLLTGNASNFASGAGWTINASTLDTSGTNTLKIDVTADGAGVYNTGLLTVGQRYRMTMQVSAITQNWELRAFDGSSQLTLASISTGSNQLEFTVPKGSNGNLHIYSTQSGTSSITIDASSTVMELVRIGCVAEYLPTGINSTRWMDTSGNGLHGTTSTATAVNHKIGSLTLATLSTDAVTFDSASGTTTSSTLDHFEQGTWAPVLSDGTNNATMHANNIGTYTRIGSTVFVNAQVMVSSLGSVSGNVRITGLPYQPATTGTTVRNYWAAASVTHGWSLAITANQSVGGFIRDNLSYIELRLWDATGGTTELQHSEVTADGELMIHAMYYC